MDSATESSIGSTYNMDEVIKNFRNPNYEECQKIRDRYSEVSEKLRLMSMENGEGGCSIDKLTDELASINELITQRDKNKKTVTPASEGNMDAHVLKEISRLAKANIQKTQASFLTFNPSEYARKVEQFSCDGKSLAQVFAGDFTTLNKMAKALSCLYRTTYGLEPLYGALEWEPPTRSAREVQKKRDDTNVVKKTLKKVQSSSTDEENQMVEVLRIHKVLRRRVMENGNSPVEFLQFVIDPTCFSTTVQNIFHTSFLIRDRKAKLNFDGHKIPYISHVEEGRKESFPDNESNHQSVVEMSLDLWQEAIEIMNIKDAMIPKVSKSNKRSSQSSQF